MRPVVITQEYREWFAKVLLRTYFSGAASSDKDEVEETIRPALTEHIESRYRVFNDCMIPWIKTKCPDLCRLHAVEIGSGTGSSTLAIAQHVKSVTCFEIDEVSNTAARERLDYFGLRNVSIRHELFGPQSSFFDRTRQMDIVFMCAVLEHMTFAELRETLRTAWQGLTPGGYLVVVDTPNRLAFMDGHTSLMPFYASLPAQIRKEYAIYSPRIDFQQHMSSLTDDAYAEPLTRWGSGISYHEFDLSLGPAFHQYVVLDGYEPELRGCAPVFADDGILQALFTLYQVPAHRAFTRSNLHFVVRKPAIT